MSSSADRIEQNRGKGTKGGQFGYGRVSAPEDIADARVAALDDNDGDEHWYDDDVPEVFVGSHGLRCQHKSSHVCGDCLERADEEVLDAYETYIDMTPQQQRAFDRLLGGDALGSGRLAPTAEMSDEWNDAADAALDSAPTLVAVPDRDGPNPSVLPDSPFPGHVEFAQWMDSNVGHDSGDGTEYGKGAWAPLEVDGDHDWDNVPHWQDGYRMAVAFDEPIENPSNLVAYYMRGPVGMGPDGYNGEYNEMNAETAGPVIESADGSKKSRVWIFACDLTKSPRDDIGHAMDGLVEHVQIGSPERKTDRSGPGTKGTRAVNGVGANKNVNIAVLG